MQRDMEYRLTFGEKQLLSMELGVKISISVYDSGILVIFLPPLKKVDN